MTIQELQKRYKLSQNDFWELSRGRSSVWIITHDACEKIAAQEGITTFKVEVLNSEWNFCRLLVTMTFGNKAETSIGEALLNDGTVLKEYESYGKKKQIMKGNCESQYIGAMAEKRGKDRCILKLINAYEYGIYSDSESDDFKRVAKKTEKDKNQAVTDQLATKLSFTEQCDYAKKKELFCNDCGSEVLYYELKNGEARLKCPKDWKDKSYSTKAEREQWGNDPQHGFVQDKEELGF